MKLTKTLIFDYKGQIYAINIEGTLEQLIKNVNNSYIKEYNKDGMLLWTLNSSDELLFDDMLFID